MEITSKDLSIKIDPEDRVNVFIIAVAAVLIGLFNEKREVVEGVFGKKTIEKKRR